ncbi:hypothetical protein SNR37_000115 [Agarivorans aestuarii]|uniref:Uncharacterized protein n=1 Tax=Agarivorans aestuarii TaxID=1563703 RepID=A0ABU7G5W3_9ALTE|nr:hypothetical protein [Agarivorans aestuarii]MEE1674796.1 hypothetical protein [Agarivorans aestuarii]
MNNSEKIAELEKKITRVTWIESPGAIMFGLGLYGKYGTGENAFHPLLNDVAVVNSLLVAGGLIMIWGGYNIFTLKRQQNRLTKT